MTTTPKVAKALEDLRSALIAEYGADYAFTVAGRGQLLAASNLRSGVVYAETHPARPVSAYRLPDGDVVYIFDDTARGEPTISYTLAGGTVVTATRVDEPRRI